MQLLIKKNKNPRILSCFSWKVDLDYGNFINVAMVLPETKKKGMKQKSKCQVDQAYSL